MQALLVFLAIAALSSLASSRTRLDPGRLPGLAQLAASGLIFLEPPRRVTEGAA